MGAAAGLLLSQFPLRPIINEALERKGSFETIGFKRLFCPLFQLLGKVGRRRHKNKKLLEKQAVGDSKEKLQRVLRIATGASHPRNDITKRK